MQIISASEIDSVMDWGAVVDTLHAAHLRPRPIGDSFFVGDADYGLLSRGVILPGYGAGLKIASMCAANDRAQPPRPVEDAVFVVIDEATKAIRAVLDGPAITRWKTAADSVVAAKKLSREDSEVLLSLGAGPVSRSLIDAYLHIRPGIRKVLLWNRTPSKLSLVCESLRTRGLQVEIARDLSAAIRKADIISAATSTRFPLIEGRYVKMGAHVDLVGGYRQDMQEADVDLMCRSRLFVDDRSTSSVAGDIHIPLILGAISETQIEGDLYDLCQNEAFMREPGDITVYKNAGGAHLDLVVSHLALSRLALNTAARRH